LAPGSTTRPDIATRSSPAHVAQRGHEQLFDPCPRQFDEIHGALGDPNGEGAMREHDDFGELANDRIRRERGSEQKLEKFSSGTNTSVSATWRLPVPPEANTIQLQRRAGAFQM